MKKTFNKGFSTKLGAITLGVTFVATTFFVPVFGENQIGKSYAIKRIDTAGGKSKRTEPRKTHPPVPRRTLPPR